MSARNLAAEAATAVSPMPDLLVRLFWMRDEQGRDPIEMVNRQVALGEMSQDFADDLIRAIADDPRNRKA